MDLREHLVGQQFEAGPGQFRWDASAKGVGHPHAGGPDVLNGLLGCQNTVDPVGFTEFFDTVGPLSDTPRPRRLCARKSVTNSQGRDRSTLFAGAPFAANCAHTSTMQSCTMRKKTASKWYTERELKGLCGNLHVSLSTRASYSKLPQVIHESVPFG